MMNPSDDFLPPDLASMVDAELAKGERLAWIARPIPWRLAASSLPLVVFGVPFTGFALFWIAVSGGMPHRQLGGPFSLFPLVGIPFVLVGLGMLLSPFWMVLRAMRTVHAVTDRRALTIERGPLGRVVVRSFEPPSLAVLSRTQHADGSGDLVFRREFRHSGQHGRYVDVGFFAIPDVKGAEEQVHELLRGADAPGGDRR